MAIYVTGLFTIATHSCQDQVTRRVSDRTQLQAAASIGSVNMLLRIVCAAVLVHFCLAAPSGYEHEDSRENSITIVDQQHPFDLLIFTQRWPITACYEWRETGKGHICGLPSPATVWTIHGIWPTKWNTIGPAFCNKSAIFDPSQLAPIEQQLKEHWLNVEKNKPDDSLWEHEWLKHGTCAAETIEQLNTESKYFQQGLTWLEQHSVDGAFAASGGIQPGYNYSLATLNKALVAYYGKNVAIECFYDHKTRQQLLNEVRICFDKQLQSADCDGIVGLERTALPESRVATVISNCNGAKSIFIPASVPADMQPKVKRPETVVYERITERKDGQQQSYEFVEVILV
ncbi:ribonuclease Oy [Anopheles stephensi]|uniref:ribonuclease Oy n=1 Tax=Anopheles stephensi TaxID=30069 RepID=UPI001658AD5D|nr:ribonuclease Oy [Anopheles stephensi]